jgi:hypothetical protein
MESSWRSFLKVSSNVDLAAPLLVVAVTVTFLGLFWFLPAGPQGESPRPPSMAGRTLSLEDDKPMIPIPDKPELPAPAREVKRTDLATAGRRRAARKPRRLALPSPVSTSNAAVQPTTAPATADFIHDYTLQEIADTYEADPSKYPLNRTAQAGGISLHLDGLERRDELFVLKVTVANAGDTDFYVKALTAQAGDSPLGSRAIFQILVEAQRSREGYLLFRSPPPGAAVQITLKEDGGKGRAVLAPVPYRF